MSAHLLDALVFGAVLGVVIGLLILIATRR